VKIDPKFVMIGPKIVTIDPKIVMIDPKNCASIGIQFEDYRPHELIWVFREPFANDLAHMFDE